jgi:alpha-N-acetylglucosaminidase
MKIGGRLAWMSQGPADALTDPNRGQMSGIGALMESTGVNPALWEMLLENAWRTNAPDLQTWLEDYARRRYGAKIPEAGQAWKILAETVYNAPPPSNEHTTKPAVCARPSLAQPALPAVMQQPIENRPITSPHYDPVRVLEAWKLLLAAAPEAKHSDGYRFDLCDVGRQALADLSTRYNYEIVDAYKARDAARLQKLSDKMLALIRDLDTLTGARREWLLGVWLADARSWGATPAEKDLCERNARELLTTWTRFDNITDYANRQWNGLLGQFYYRRWEMWLQALNDSPAHGKALDESATRNQIRDWELSWTRQTGGHFATAPHGDAIAISRRLIAKYAPEISRPTGNAQTQLSNP